MEKLAIEIVKVNDKGGIVLPKSFREKFGLTQGTHILFKEDENGDIRIQKIDPDLLENGNTNYQPFESGEERNQPGGNKYGSMAERTTPESNFEGLDVSQRKPHPTD